MRRVQTAVGAWVLACSSMRVLAFASVLSEPPPLVVSTLSQSLVSSVLDDSGNWWFDAAAAPSPVRRASEEASDGVCADTLIGRGVSLANRVVEAVSEVDIGTAKSKCVDVCADNRQCYCALLRSDAFESRLVDRLGVAAAQAIFISTRSVCATAFTWRSVCQPACDKAIDALILLRPAVPEPAPPPPPPPPPYFCDVRLLRKDESVLSGPYRFMPAAYSTVAPEQVLDEQLTFDSGAVYPADQLVPTKQGSREQKNMCGVQLSGPHCQQVLAGDADGCGLILGDNTDCDGCKEGQIYSYGDNILVDTANRTCHPLNREEETAVCLADPEERYFPFEFKGAPGGKRDVCNDVCGLMVVLGE